jgi:hypothetical protein
MLDLLGITDVADRESAATVAELSARWILADNLEVVKALALGLLDQGRLEGQALADHLSAVAPAGSESLPKL